MQWGDFTVNREPSVLNFCDNGNQPLDRTTQPSNLEEKCNKLDKIISKLDDQITAVIKKNEKMVMSYADISKKSQTSTTKP